MLEYLNPSVTKLAAEMALISASLNRSERRFVEHTFAEEYQRQLKRIDNSASQFNADNE